MDNKKIIRLEELLKFPAETTIPATEGTITKIGKRFAGVTKQANTPYSFQDVVLVDGAATIIMVMKDRDEFPATFLNKKVSLLCHHGDHGVTGIKLRERDKYQAKNGEKETVLWITPTAAITLASTTSEVPAPVPAQAAPQAPAQQSQTAKPTAQADPPAKKNGPQWWAVAERIDRMVDVMSLITSRIATKMSEQVEQRSGYKMLPEHIQGASSTIFIQYMMKYGADGLPVNPLPAPKQDQTPVN